METPKIARGIELSRSIVARNSNIFYAIHKKLILEIALLVPTRPNKFRRAGFILARTGPPQNVRAATNRYICTKGCDVGERMREGYSDNDDT